MTGAVLFEAEVAATYFGPPDDFDARTDRIAEAFHGRVDIRDPSLGATLTTGELEFSMVVEARGRQAARATAAQVVGEVLAAAGGDATAWQVGTPRVVS